MAKGSEPDVAAAAEFGSTEDDVLSCLAVVLDSHAVTIRLI